MILIINNTYRTHYPLIQAISPCFGIVYERLKLNNRLKYAILNINTISMGASFDPLFTHTLPSPFIRTSGVLISLYFSPKHGNNFIIRTHLVSPKNSISLFPSPYARNSHPYFIFFLRQTFLTESRLQSRVNLWFACKSGVFYRILRIDWDEAAAVPSVLQRKHPLK